MNPIVTVNVSGRRYEICRDTLSRFPNSTLGRLASMEDNIATFHRLSSIFKCVLSYFETGHLHIPTNACPAAVQVELDFWGFTIDDLDVCCRRKLLKFYGEQKYLKKFDESVTAKQEHGCCSTGNSQGCVAKARNQLWLILDTPSSSVVAKIYFMISSLIVIMSIVVVFLESMDELNEKMSAENWKEYYGDDYDNYRSKVRFLTGEDEYEVQELADSQNITTEEMVGNFTLPSEVHKNPSYIFPISMFCTVFFVVELLLKFLSCPNLTLMLTSLLHIIDILAVAVTVTHAAMDITRPEGQYTVTFMDAIGALLVLRVLRLFRLARGVTGASVLYYTVRHSYKELGFMALLIAINTVVFGTLAYNVDRSTMQSLPLASWWALITMTTVGYGDIVPSNHSGRMVGVVCACMGIGLLALSMPLFVDNFLTLYSYASVLCEQKEAAASVKVAPGKDVHDNDAHSNKALDVHDKDAHSNNAFDVHDKDAHSNKAIG